MSRQKHRIDCRNQDKRERDNSGSRFMLVYPLSESDKEDDDDKRIEKYL